MSTTALISSNASSTYGQSVTFTATVTPASGSGMTGTVQFQIDGGNVGSPVALNGTTATYTTSTLAGGGHTITAVYNGDINYTASGSPTVAQNITQAASSIALTSSHNSAPFGQSIILTATVTSSVGNTAGSVTFQNGSAVLGTSPLNASGIATLTTSALALGSQSITAAYSGNGDYVASSSSSLTQTITPAATHLIVTGPDAGDTTDGPLVKVFDATTGNLNFSFLAYDKGFLGAVRVAMGDFNGDGTPDIVTATGTGGVPLVNVYDGKTGAMFAEFYAYSPNYLGGVEIAVADVTGSGHPDIITSTDAGGVPLVNVFNSAGTLLLNFWAYDSHYIGGVRIASGDFSGDGKAQIVTSTAGGGQPLVNVFNWVGTLLGNFYGDDPSYTGGLQIAVANFTNDGIAKIATYRDQATTAQVKLYNLSTQQQFNTLTLGDSTLPLHLRLAATDANNDGLGDLVTVPAPGNSAEVEIFSGVDGSLIRKWSPYPSPITTGLFVAAG